MAKKAIDFWSMTKKELAPFFIVRIHHNVYLNQVYQQTKSPKTRQDKDGIIRVVKQAAAYRVGSLIKFF